jgi:hypothetical protein
MGRTGTADEGGGAVNEHPPWSDRRRRTLLGLAAGMLVATLGAIALPAGYGTTAGFLAALCGFLLVAATIVFILIPGPGTLGTLLRTVPLAGAVLVVAVLLLLSTSAQLRVLWALLAAGAAVWTATAFWAARRSGG